MKHLLIILLATITNIVWADEGVDITNPIQALEVHNLQEKIDAVSATIKGCIDSGEEHGACMCKHKALILQLNSSVKSLF